jgi:hypothetical protein
LRVSINAQANVLLVPIFFSGAGFGGQSGSQIKPMPPRHDRNADFAISQSRLSCLQLFLECLLNLTHHQKVGS